MPPNARPRQRKTPRQRAEEALATKNRKVVRLDKQIDRLTADLAAARREQAEVIRRRDYLAENPDLPQQPTRSKTSSTTTPEETPHA